MTRMMMAFQDGVDPFNYTTFHKGKGSAPPPPPPPQKVQSVKPVVEEASVEITDKDGKKRRNSQKSKLKMPLATGKFVGTKFGNGNPLGKAVGAMNMSISQRLKK